LIDGPSGKVLKPFIGEKGGHLYVLIRNRRLRVHHAVLLTFVGPRPDGQIGLHGDDDPTNNAVENLSWGTRLDNAADRRRNRGYPRGADAPGACLTAQQVEQIRLDSRSARAVAADYGVSHTSILEIRRGNRWVA
jgi:hypothetical protein